MRDVVLAEEIGCLIWRDGHAAARPDPAALLRSVFARVDVRDDDARAHHRIEVLYDGEDLDEVARVIGRPREDVIALHSQVTYHVAMVGFMPGFAYMRGLPKELLGLPRRAPRPRVPQNSVAIAAEYAGIYPFASPGGWHLLGRAVGFQAFQDDRAALSLGDLVSFVPTASSTAATHADLQAPVENVKAGPHLEITRAAGFAVPVREHVGRMHEGIPPGGPLVRSARARANRLVGNPAGAPAIEIVGSFEFVARGCGLGRTIAVASSPSTGLDRNLRRVGGGFGDVRLEDGATLRVETGSDRVRYLAIEGGVDAPLVLGPQAALRRGDRIFAGGSPDHAADGDQEEERRTDGGIAIVGGPDHVEGAWELLTSRPFRISSSSNRTGVRLEADAAFSSLLARSPATSSGSRASLPMVIGAIELTPSGFIVLGPDHPTTGGYPVIAVVRPTSLDSFFATPMGGSVRFRE